ncbi:Sodium-coupled monocarboxylate transporter 1 [Holothuria leucospilota]|uniref:Sodium-coupled monocarboxylate transporter 1 n=1 Tax=Holothuria leucospilota TaxID=206669 RepID=A0A9Q1BCI6_HOLLE|nr:Sodium-coupled monocarboxylate transporter 1 [Holothuria leucospilota]
MAYLSLVDYIVFALFLLFSASVGIYHGIRSRTRQSTSEYLLAGRSMQPLPVGISIAVSLLSAVAYLGTPAEIYIHGPVFWTCSVGSIFQMFIVSTAFCPVYYNLKITSVFEYIDMRFGKYVRFCGVASNLLFLFLYMGIVIYGPSLALNAVTGLSLKASIISVGVVCTFYTTIGGIRAVVWTDLFQGLLLLAGLFITIISCAIQVGGLGETFKINIRDGRDTFLDFRLNPTIRHTTWSVIIGIASLQGGYFSTNQIIVQRYMACQTLTGAKLAIYFGSILIAFIQILLVLAGICLYAYFARCDPYTAGKVQNPDQLMAYIILDIFQNTPGMGGLLISAVFSASLSTVSSGINALTALVNQDILGTVCPGLSDFKRSMVLKFAAILFGTATILLAFLASIMGGLLPMTFKLVGILNGPVFGVFCLGIFFPWANSKGAMIGLIFGAAVGIWVNIGSMVYPPILDDPPLFVDQCETILTNQTSIPFVAPLEPTSFVYVTEHLTRSDVMESSRPGIAKFYSLSYIYYSLLASVTTIMIGLICSFLTHPNSPSDVDPKLISPWTRNICKWRHILLWVRERKHTKGTRHTDDHLGGDNGETMQLHVNEKLLVSPSV